MSIIQEFLTTLPKVKFGFMYGSSYLLAPSGKDSTAQIDLILSVDNTYDWHKANLKLNPSHYSGRIRLLGTDYLVNSSHQSVGIHYNPFVHFQNLTFKYGVIHHDHLKDDLQEWNTFYVAGRMQKPVKIIQECEDIKELMENNYKMAAITASLMLPSLVHETDLYMAICKLSYYGDRRLEDPKKVRNLVFGNLEKFKEAYRPIVNGLTGLKVDNEFIERSPFFYDNVKCLPGILKDFKKGFEDMNLSERTQAIEDVLTRNNSKFSTKQIVHTLKTGDFWQIFKYSLAKLRKAFK